MELHKIGFRLVLRFLLFAFIVTDTKSAHFWYSSCGRAIIASLPSLHEKGAFLSVETKTQVKNYQNYPKNSKTKNSLLHLCIFPFRRTHSIREKHTLGPIMSKANLQSFSSQASFTARDTRVSHLLTMSDTLYVTARTHGAV